MFTATMTYTFKKECISEALELWKEVVFKAAAGQAGLIRMQLLVSDNTAMAIGTWKEKNFAENFMKTGVFKALMEKLEPFLKEPPKQASWKLKYYLETQ